MKLDETDRAILDILQRDCKTSLQTIGDAVRMSAPSVVDRIRKLEQNGVVRGYRAILDGAALELDVGAFIGVSMNYPKVIGELERTVLQLPEVLECHHVTGGASLLLKVRTESTRTLEALISRLREIPGVDRTETMVILSTRTERTELPLPAAVEAPPLRKIRGGK